MNFLRESGMEPEVNQEAAERQQLKSEIDQERQSIHTRIQERLASPDTDTDTDALESYLGVLDELDQKIDAGEPLESIKQMHQERVAQIQARVDSPEQDLPKAA